MNGAAPNSFELEGPARVRRDSRARHLPGARIGRLVVVRRVANEHGNAKYLCRCDCGREAVVTATALSCGCLRRQRIQETQTRHGHTRGRQPTRLYSTWRSMWKRCEDRSHKSYADYGGRGIRVCERWRKFEAFAADMGERPPGTSIDRIDVNGHYEPRNCRWATPSAQGLNKRTNHAITLDGVTKTISEWAASTGLSHELIGWRLRNGWSVSDALSKKPDRRRQPKGRVR